MRLFIYIILLILIISIITGCSDTSEEPPYFVFEEGNFINDKNINQDNAQLKVDYDVRLYNLAGTCVF